MEVLAKGRFAGISARKARLVLEHLPGKSVQEAINLLTFMPTPHAKLIAKIVKSAASNAENNYSLDPDALYVKRAVADGARRDRRMRPAARGRMHPYYHRSSHITITVDEREG
jgi:large subunit ribosomal protein L22